MGNFAMGRVALVVHDLDRVGAFYETAVGLQRLSKSGGLAQYGVGDQVLLELRADPAARRRNPREAGLFHSAFLLPSRVALGQWVLQAAAARLPVAGLADHLVSEAVYLNDPEGNGIEIYADRPRSGWQWSKGLVEMTTDPLDVDGLMAAAQDAGPWQGAPQGTTMGHVHLQVGQIPEAEAFWTKTMGLDLTARYPGGSFFAADGYHHHVATNVWQSRGAGPRDLPATGLADVEIRLDTARAAAIPASPDAAGRLTLRDPWNTPISLTLA